MHQDDGVTYHLGARLNAWIDYKDMRRSFTRVPYARIRRWYYACRGLVDGLSTECTRCLSSSMLANMMNYE